MLVDITRQDEHVKHTETQSIRDRNTTRGVLIQQLANLSALLTGSARRVVHGEIGCSKWKKTLAYLLVLPGSRARIVRCGGRYDPQLVKRSSE